MNFAAGGMFCEGNSLKQAKILNSQPGKASQVRKVGLPPQSLRGLLTTCVRDKKAQTLMSS
jgi:hypothetical protein